MRRCEGAPKYGIGTTPANDVDFEDRSGCALSACDGRTTATGDVMGPAIYFEQLGTQPVRVQVNEDGFSIDQIVLSAADKYFSVAPGALKNDTTIVSR